MAHVDVPIERVKFLRTSRRDNWWVAPLVVFLILGSFVAYATFRAIEGTNYHYGNYLSPFYSPEIFGVSPHSWFGAPPAWWPHWLTPAMVILWAPAGFRLTCYYYRGSYYKAFWADPPSCTVGEPRAHYRGEHKLPLILQNLHRYFLYLALVFIVFLAHDAWKAMWFDDAAGVKHFGIGVGTIVLCANVVLLAGYTWGCHSLRHLVGGVLDVFSRRPVRKRVYDCVSCLNRHHMKWAWMSLFAVMFADLYVRMVSSGAWTDWRIF
jgi:hypothetical protein